MWLNLLSVSFIVVCFVSLYPVLLSFFGIIMCGADHKHHPCVFIYTFHVLTGHNWKKTSTIIILVLLVLLATSSGIWLLASAGKLHLMFE